MLSGKIMSDSMSKGQLGQEIEKNGSLCGLYLKLQGAYYLVYVWVCVC